MALLCLFGNPQLPFLLSCISPHSELYYITSSDIAVLDQLPSLDKYNHSSRELYHHFAIIHEPPFSHFSPPSRLIFVYSRIPASLLTFPNTGSGHAICCPNIRRRCIPLSLLRDVAVIYVGGLAPRHRADPRSVPSRGRPRYEVALTYFAQDHKRSRCVWSSSSEVAVTRHVAVLE